MSIILKININQEKKFFISNIIKILLDYDGIIFGNYVIDEIISDYYSNLYKKKYPNSTINEFWDDLNDNETKYRTKISNKINIVFNKKNNINKILTELETKFIISDTIKSEINYDDNLSLKINKIELTISLLLGKTFVYSGIKITLKLNILIINYQSSLIEPPFYKTKFIHNIFIKDKFGIRISKTTGTIIDKMTDIEKIIITTNIIKNKIIKFETELIGLYSNIDNCYVVKKISKMIKENTSWNIINLPFIIKYIDDIKDNEDMCLICQQEYQKNEKIIELSSKIKYHCNCLLQYLDIQVIKVLDNKHEYIPKCFKCPLRLNIDFINVKIPNYDIMKEL